MRILLSCLQSLKKHSLPAYEFWRPYFLQGCQEAGIECVEVPNVDWVEGLTYADEEELTAWRTRLWETVLDFVRQEQERTPIQFFLSYLYPKQIDVTAIRELQTMGIPCVNFFCDNVREFHKVPAEYFPFTLHWVPEFEALSMYRAAGLPHVHAPMPCWVPPALRTLPEGETEPATFIGSADILRRDLLGRALQSGADFVIRGPGWEANPPSAATPSTSSSFGRLLTNQIDFVQSHGWRGLYTKLADRLRPLQSPPVEAAQVRPAVFGAEYFRVTREASVTIGINRVPTARTSNHHPLTYSRLRDIEAPMLGACYLTEWTQGIEHLYELGAEVETFRTTEELNDKLETLTRDTNRRRLMRERAQRRALTDHCVARSLSRIRRCLSL